MSRTERTPPPVPAREPAEDPRGNPRPHSVVENDRIEDGLVEVDFLHDVGRSPLEWHETTKREFTKRLADWQPHPYSKWPSYMLIAWANYLADTKPCPHCTDASCDVCDDRGMVFKGSVKDEAVY